MSYTYATVCSGVEGCSLALEGMDWTPIFFAEIEPFPCAVLKSHYPEVPNLGDMSKISYNKEQGVITNGTRNIQFSGRLDLLAGGTPCQDFSVAGKRAGGEKGSGTRSSLCWEWLRLVSELGPRVVLWENVVGTFSSNNGRDFYEFVREVANLGYCVSWRVLDAQFTRVDSWPMAIPQRRRRVWLVGCAGDDVASVAEILFESRSIVGDTPPRRVTRQAVARTAQDRNSVYAPVVGASCIALDGDKLKPREDQRKGGNGFGINESEVGYTLTSVDRHGCAYGIGNGQLNSAQITIGAKEISQTLDCMEDPQKVMIEHEVYRIDSTQSNSMKSSNPNSGIHKVDSAQTLDTTTPTPVKNQGGDVIVECYDRSTRARNPDSNGNLAPCLLGVMGTGGGNEPIVTTYEHHGQDSRVANTNECCPTLGTTASNNPLTGNNPLVVGTLDLMGGKTGAHFGNGETSPTLTHGRGSASDVHAIVSQGCDTYNQTMTGDASPTIRGTASDVDHVGAVVSQGIAFDGRKEQTPVIDEVSQTLTSGTCPGYQTGVVISTNSNGGDVMPSINANESKLGGDNQHIRGGGYIVSQF